MRLNYHCWYSFLQSQCPLCLSSSTWIKPDFLGGYSLQRCSLLYWRLCESSCFSGMDTGCGMEQSCHVKVFVEAAMCSWSMKAVTCHVGNVNVPYTVMKYADPLLPSSGGWIFQSVLLCSHTGQMLLQRIVVTTLTIYLMHSHCYKECFLWCILIICQYCSLQGLDK